MSRDRELERMMSDDPQPGMSTFDRNWNAAHGVNSLGVKEPKAGGTILYRLAGEMTVRHMVILAGDKVTAYLLLNAAEEMKKAADEIERLRLEMSIPRDEYAMTWKNLLDRIDGLDIVEWIRAYANAYSPSDYSSPIAREVVVRSDAKWMQAADEIERLRARVAKLENELRLEVAFQNDEVQREAL